MNSKNGRAVAVANERVVFGYGSNSAGLSSGSVQAYRYDGHDWVFEATLLSTDLAAWDQFGDALGMEGDLALIGEPGADVAGLEAAGAAYVFRHDGSAWQQVAKRTAPTPRANARFGESVALAPASVVVGSPSHGATDVGRVYAFQGVGTTWSLQQVLIASSADGRFGHALDADSETLVVGGAQDAALVGAAYVSGYNRTTDLWFPLQTLQPTSLAAGATFGYDVAVDGDQLAVFVYQRGGLMFAPMQMVTGSTSASGDRSGSSIALAGDTLLTGAVLDGRPALGHAVTFGVTNTWATQSPGAVPVLVLCTAPDPAYPCGSPLPGANMSGAPTPAELLVGVQPPNPFLYLIGPPWAGFGQPSPISIAVPPIPALVGDEVFVQGALIDPSSAFVQVAATRAVRLRIGS